MKTLLITLLIICLPVGAFAEFWGTKTTKKFHTPSCSWAQKIKPNNLVKFKTVQEAKQSGFVPCKVCKPN